jgi:hypothetical protein
MQGWSKVLLQNQQTYSQADALAANSTKLLGAFVPPACRAAALQLICYSFFVPCTYNLATASLTRTFISLRSFLRFFPINIPES